MLNVSWEVGSDSESVLMTSLVLSNSDSSSTRHSSSDLELNSVVQWLAASSLTLLIKDPTLVGAVVAVVPDGVSVVGV